MPDTPPIHVHVHVYLPDTVTQQLAVLIQQGHQIMNQLDDLRAQLAAANTTTNQISTLVTEIASDLDELIAKLAAGAPGSQEVIDATAEATALTARLSETAAALTGVAAKYPAPPTP